MHKSRAILYLLLAINIACGNNPYPSSEERENIFYTTFREEPKHLDPARSYSSDEYKIINQIYEPPLQYHYLKRPYELIPLTVEEVPKPLILDSRGHLLPLEAPESKIAKVIYEIKIKKNIRYEDHPAFAKDKQGRHYYHNLSLENLKEIDHPNQLSHKATRELTAHDYAYQIKRLAHPLISCPIFPVLVNYISGFADFYQTLKKEINKIRSERKKSKGIFYNQEADEKKNPIYLDLRKYELPGVQVKDRYTLRIILKKKYPQFTYWLAMPFFAPIPWEVDYFYSQSATVERNFILDRFPVGTGPFTLSLNAPNYRMVLEKNPNFRNEMYPQEGSKEDQEKGLLDDKGRKLPFLDKAVFVLEKESIPSYTKFLQGYYDNSGISSDIFDSAVVLDEEGVGLTKKLKEKGIHLVISLMPGTFYYAFNMIDKVIGGYSQKNKKLRQAISIALNIEEFIQIFMNGRAIAAHGPIPQGVWGFQKGKAGINRVVYKWNEAIKKPQRKSLDFARKLLAEAGYPNGIGKDGKPLVLFYDTTSSASGKSEVDWLRKKFKSINIDLQIRSTDYNQFRSKVRNGNYQIFRFGWQADYPDPENFLFLLYGPNGKVKYQGENAANYDNQMYNVLFREVETMPNSPLRLEKIKKMLTILREDAPWIWGFHPMAYSLYHSWYKNAKPMTIGENSLKYKRILPEIRAKKRDEWNKIILWPLFLFLLILIALLYPAIKKILKKKENLA